MKGKSEEIINTPPPNCEKAYKILADSLLDGLLIIQNKVVVFENKVVEDILGKSLLNLTFSKLFDYVLPKYHKYLQSLLNSRETGNKIKFIYELEIIKSDNIIIPVEISSQRIEYKGADAEIAIIRDVSYRNESDKQIKRLAESLEKKVELRTEELNKLNKSLQDFTSAVTHDLKIPMRHSKGYLNLLKKELNLESCKNLINLENSLEDMDRKVSQLFEFSRLGNKQVTKVPTDINKIINNIIAQYNSFIKNRVIEWNIQKLPIINVDAALFKIVLENLISNAVKFTKNKIPAKISISSNRLPQNNIEIIISDNGDGFDMKYSSKLFHIFQRLHSSNEFEGSGVGLATAKEIVVKHGGEIFADSTPGKGTSFKIILYS